MCYIIIKLSLTKGDGKMGIIVCQDCDKVIETYEDEKVTTLYGTCPECNDCE
ncbi:hypothetical protein GCM10010978_08850 [Compostibacillus humi]|uniref:GapA-binding peptide SR1P n=1 Tax=Compostibacillus humi TaxID=1245525 RepID=A0A8J2ZQ55_9BACI|nr:hypothetical protein GCM10010978_08850 [Compostibacillus humi]